MSKKNSNVQNLKSILRNHKKSLEIYSEFNSNLKKTIKKDSFLVAVSGGGDSLALTALSELYKSENKNKVFFVLIDHGIRQNSKAEAEKVKKLLKKKGIALSILTNKKKINKDIQNLARKARYNLLVNFCIKKNCKFILTGHHSDDQVETFLIRLSRGSGIQGLSSMSKITTLSKKIKLLRPLLDIKKKDLVFIAKKFFNKIIQDHSNKNKRYLRIKIRRLTKILEESGIRHEQIIRSINNISSSKNTLNKYIKHVSNDCMKKSQNSTTIDLNKLFSETIEIRLRIIGNAIEHLNKAYYPPRSKKVLSLISSFDLKKKTKHTLGGCILEQKKGSLLIYKEGLKRQKKH